MDNAEQQLAEKLQSSNNVLVTVSRNPSVDQLSALLGLSLMLNKLGKHCAAVFSGKIPSTIEFLKPEETIEKNTDSLRDFIIALDKSKADKLRYKVEDNIVRIFITPYRTSISEKDLDFSQGDFNVDIVVAIGVHEQIDLDEAITAHGRILHDAVLATINNTTDGSLGSINWNNGEASSLSELIAGLAHSMGDDLLDEQIATALLTGIVSETDRFSNDKTTSETMAVSGDLMEAGANQQLVSSKLEEKHPVKPTINKSNDNTKSNEDDKDASSADLGTLQISHDDKDKADIAKTNNKDDKLSKPVDEDKKTATPTDHEPAIELPTPAPAPSEELDQPFNLPVFPELSTPPPTPAPLPEITPISAKPLENNLSPGPKLVTEPPSLGGTLTANINQNDIDPVTDPFSMPQEEEPKLLDRKPNPSASSLPLGSPLFTPSNSSGNDSNVPQTSTMPPVDGLTPPPPSWIPPTDDQNPIDGNDGSSQVHIDENGTLSQLEQAVKSPHVEPTTTLPNADSARDEINRALSEIAASVPPPPLEGLNAQPLGPELHEQPSASVGIIQPSNSQADDSSSMPPPANNSDDLTTGTPEPPPVPPPIPFEFGKPPQS